MYKVIYANGATADEYDTYAEAVANLEGQYPEGVIGHDGDLSEGGDRTLVWESEADSEDDAGQKAVCQIVKDAE